MIGVGCDNCYVWKEGLHSGALSHEHDAQGRHTRRKEGHLDYVAQCINSLLSSPKNLWLFHPQGCLTLRTNISELFIWLQYVKLIIFLTFAHNLRGV